MRRAPFSAAAIVAIAASMLVVSAPASAANPSSDFLFALTNGEISILDYQGTGTDVEIPAEISVSGVDYPVTDIAAESFRGNGNSYGAGVYLTSVIIPDTVVSIGANAFRGGYLSSLVIPDSVVTIGTYAFYNHLLESVTFGDSLTTLGNNSFRGNYLTSLTIPASVTSIGNNTFADNQTGLNTLTSVIFEGNAPTLSPRSGPNGSFTDAGPILYYYAGATGFSLLYQGYFAVQISASESDLTASPVGSVLADGTAAFTLTATVRDETEAVVAGVPVAFTVPADLTASDTTCTTGSDGTCAITLTSLTAGDFAITAKIGSDPTVLSRTVTFTEVPVAPVFTASMPPETATVGVPYSYTFAATGFPDATFALASGALPAGLDLASDGVVSGTPTAAGPGTFTVTASNEVAPDATTDPLTITVAAAPAAPVFTASAPPATALIGDEYTYTFTATGNPTPTFSVGSGTLPAGLELASDGVLSGTLTAVGSSTFTVAASNTVAPDAESSALTITVSAIPVAPVFTASAPPATATVGEAYSYTFAATGAPAPTFSVASGTLPAGLTLTSAGVLSGVPTAVGPSTFTIAASNGVAPDAVTTAVTITVAAAVVPDPDPTTSPTPDAEDGDVLASTGLNGLPALLTLSGTLVVAGFIALSVLAIRRRRALS